MKHNTDIWFDTDLEADLLKILNGQDPTERVSFGNGTHVFSAVRNEVTESHQNAESMIQFETTMDMSKSNLLRKFIQMYIKGYTGGWYNGWTAASRNRG